MLLKIHPDNPDDRSIRKVVGCLKDGGIIVYPTDTIYGLACDLNNHRAIERLAQIKGVKPEKANFSLVCYDLSHISDFCKQLDNGIYKLMRRSLPGPFTFILNAGGNVPKLLRSKRKTIGIRVPDNNIARVIVKELGNPILTTSIHHNDEILEYMTDPELIYESHKDIAEIVVDAGYGSNTPSTVVDCTGGEPEIIRQGLGVLELVV